MAEGSLAEDLANGPAEPLPVSAGEILGREHDDWDGAALSPPLELRKEKPSISGISKSRRMSPGHCSSN